MVESILDLQMIGLESTKLQIHTPETSEASLHNSGQDTGKKSNLNGTDMMSCA